MTQIPEYIVAPAEAAGIVPARLAAAVEVESGGVVSTVIDGQDMPLILYEFHVFDRNLPPQHRDAARAEGLSAAKWGAIPYPRTQTVRYAMLDAARAFCRERGLSESIAYAACSWGVGQVLGENAEWLGYADAAALALEAMSGVEGQVRLMIRFIEKRGLHAALNSGDWSAFALGYNGPLHAKHDYAGKMTAAYARIVGHGSPVVLRIGDKGRDVRRLQQTLTDLGFGMGEPVDGIFGQGTDAMVRAFQRSRGLKEDGIAGGMTWAEMSRLSGKAVAPPQPVPTPRIDATQTAGAAMTGLGTVAGVVVAAAGAAREMIDALDGLPWWTLALIGAGAAMFAGAQAWRWIKTERVTM